MPDDLLELREADGAFESESVILSASAGHLIVDDGRGRIDADNIQDVSWVGFGGEDEGGGGDQVAVNDLSGTDVTITVDLSSGPHSAIFLTTDLTEAYVHENSAYST